MKAIEQYFPVVLFMMLYKVDLSFEFVDEILSVTIQIKPTDRHFSVLLLVVLDISLCKCDDAEQWCLTFLNILQNRIRGFYSNHTSIAAFLALSSAFLASFSRSSASSCKVLMVPSSLRLA